MTSHYFIAIPLPRTLKETLVNWQKHFKDQLTYKQWPHMEDLHITLKFLGAVEPDQLSELIAQLKKIERLPKFELTVGNIGTFGKQSMPRVLWVGVEKNESLLKLQKKVEECATNIGFSKENRLYKPHITLAKKWNSEPIDDIDRLLCSFKKEQLEITVDEIVIYQIFPSRSPKYEVIRSYSLEGGN
ncbi:RNA 2',3'-cyclic phosphodiesterase [Ornithinibacillus halophilus]|uniref:RNA 2',3'-cyclic phosphodiesterase n=1 Tax=Ornithinibacillus halophilus TaxID=930117 RepID=A0A1M5ENJ5_9BACI|nr:RNA 2',3'-cyclic phosphodiesterase [Ornithinibacillus halophilus]SHF80592.1 2'-5' RNA ligase [Ornithinibacillus halophilus]